MNTYYKATRLDGTDFQTGTIDYAAALGGNPITLPTVDDPQCCTSTVLHASTVAAEALSGGDWPCRLFLVEGEPVATEEHKRGFFSLRVVEEIDAHLALGPNGREVARMIEKARHLTEDQATAIHTAWSTARAVTRDPAWAAREAARDAAWDASRQAAWPAAIHAAWAAPQAAWDAARAAVARDLISDEHYQTLAGPWESVMGPIFDDKGVEQ